MRIYFLFLFVLASLSGATASARVTVRADLPSETFLLYEPVRLRITIHNESNERLVLGDAAANARLLLRVENVRNQVVARTDSPLFDEPWRIAPGEESSRVFNLTRLYSLRKSGDYRLRTSMQLPEESMKDRLRLFEISTGTRLQEIKTRSEDRRFELFLLNRNDQNQLLLRVSDYDGARVMRTYFLGRYLRFYSPDFQKAKDGSLAILHYERPNRLLFSRFTADGSPISKQTLNVKANERVTLREDDEEGFVVRGGGGEPLEDFVIPEEEE